MPNDPKNFPSDDFDDDALDDEFPDDFVDNADYEDDEDDEEEDEDEEEDFPKKGPSSQKEAPKKTPLKSSSNISTKEHTPLEKMDISDIPLKIQLEVARISISFEELQKMKPGSKLPVDINPRIVNLVVGGKSIGQGEIVEVGDLVGVKILELYK